MVVIITNRNTAKRRNDRFKANLPVGAVRAVGEIRCRGDLRIASIPIHTAGKQCLNKVD